jgi:hypothetical protein
MEGAPAQGDADTLPLGTANHQGDDVFITATALRGYVQFRSLRYQGLCRGGIIPHVRLALAVH